MFSWRGDIWKGTHFWITLPCSSFKKKTAYRVFNTSDTTFSPVFPVYFFSYCSRIMTYCFLLCLSKRDCGTSVQVDSCHNGNVMILQFGHSLLLCHCLILFPIIKCFGQKVYCLKLCLIDNNLLFSFVLNKNYAAVKPSLVLLMSYCNLETCF